MIKDVTKSPKKWDATEIISSIIGIVLVKGLILWTLSGKFVSVSHGFNLYTGVPYNTKYEGNYKFIVTCHLSGFLFHGAYECQKVYTGE